MKTIAIIPAAGQGKRMGTQINKQYLSLLGKPVLAYTLACFEKASDVDGIIVVTQAEEQQFCQQEVVRKYGYKKVIDIIPGGKERQDSVYQGLIKANRMGADWIIVHDGARPFFQEDILHRALQYAQTHHVGVGVAIPVKDTIKCVNKAERVMETLLREQLRAIQTPQIFPCSYLMDAYEKAYAEDFYGTDDAALVERAGYPVYLIDGNEENIKITTPWDMMIGEMILRRRLKECE